MQLSPTAAARRSRHDQEPGEYIVKMTPDPSTAASDPPEISSLQEPTRPVAPKPEAREKLLFLDGMRGLAAMLVVCEHAGYLEGRRVGGVAVHTFFVLSAFLLTMLLEKKFVTLCQQRASRTRWAYALVDYAIRRVLRVYPLLLVIAVYLAFVSNEHRHQWYQFRFDLYDYNFFKLLVFAEGHDFYVFWTLPRELLYYMCIPVFVTITVGLRRWWWVPLVPLSGWIVYFGLYKFVEGGSSFDRHLPEFLSGSIGAVVLNRVSAWIKRRDFTFTWWQRGLVRVFELVVLLVFCSVVFDALLFDANWLGPYPFQVKNSNHFVCVYVTVLIVCETVLPGPISSVLEWSLLRYAGKISFSMYLLHPRILFSDFMLAQRNYYTRFFAIWILMFVWSTISYHAVEAPSQKLASFVGKKIRALDAKEKDKKVVFVPIPEA